MMLKKIGLVIMGVSGAVMAIDKYIPLPEKVTKVFVWLGGVGVALTAQEAEW